MAMIGVRELREKTTEVIRRVREERVEYIITHQGHPVAMLLPINEDAVEAAIHQVGKQSVGDPWERLFRLLNAETTDKQTASMQDALDDIRRDD